MTLSNAIKVFRSMVDANPIYGARFNSKQLDDHVSALSNPKTVNWHIVYLQWEQGWGLDATLNISFEMKKNSKDIDELTVTVLINSSTTHRTISQTVAYAALLEQVVRLGALIETLSGTRIDEKKGF